MAGGGGLHLGLLSWLEAGVASMKSVFGDTASIVNRTGEQRISLPDH